MCMLSMELTLASICSKDVVVAVVVMLAASLLYNVWLAFLSLCWTPLRIQRAFQAQGIATLPFHFFYGNTPDILALKEAALRNPMPQLCHDITPRLLPHCHHWAQKYGLPYVYWFGSQARYHVTNAEDAKDILSSKFDRYPKPYLRPDAYALFGNGLGTLQGEKWVQHRRILNPAFSLDKLKAMVPTMESCTMTMMQNWASFIENGQVIDVHKSFKELTADIIAHTAFGSSFAEGKQVFELQTEQQILMDKLLSSIYIPWARFLPTSFNRHVWKVDRDIKRCLRRVINNREEAVESGRGSSYGNDLLGLMMAANKQELQGNQKNLTMNINEIIDECKTFFFAGHETTATLLTWSCLLLASSSEWQTRTREEVIAVCGTMETPTAETVNDLKIMGMVLNETLRLYPPGIMLIREAGTNMRLGKVMIPKGTKVTLPIILWHHDERYWGENAREFRPERFREGVAKASRVPGAFMPFSMGPHVCIGQNFALLEAKVVLSLVLRRYRFRLSPAYKHAPISVVSLQPQFGMPILFEEL